MIAHRQGATIIYPPDRSIAALFGGLGNVFEVDDPNEFDALSVVTATFATYFKYLDTIHGWLRDRGVADSRARRPSILRLRPPQPLEGRELPGAQADYGSVRCTLAPWQPRILAGQLVDLGDQPLDPPGYRLP